MAYNDRADSTPPLSRENSSSNDGRDGIAVPVRGVQSAGTAAAPSPAATAGLHPSDSRHRVSRQDWLSPPASPNPDTTPFFDESEAMRLHMVSLCALIMTS